MQEETIYEGFKQEIRGLKDPGNILIAVYILLVLLLLLFAGLESAKADFSRAKEGTFSLEPKRDAALPAWTLSPRFESSQFVGKESSENY